MVNAVQEWFLSKNDEPDLKLLQMNVVPLVSVKLHRVIAHEFPKTISKAISKKRAVEYITFSYSQFFCLYFIKILYDLHLAKQHCFKIKQSFLEGVVIVSKAHCAIMMADKSCRCDKAYSELRSKDGVRLTKAKKLFVFSFSFSLL